MPTINKPDMSQLWASGGAIVAPSTVKIQTGWTAEVPPFQWENWSQNRQDQAIAHILQQGISSWDADTEYQWSVSGIKSLVMGSDGNIYRAKQINVNQNPTTDVSDTYWELAFSTAGSSYTKAEVDAKTTVSTALQAQQFTSNTAVITPLQLSNAFKGGNQNLVPSGYQILPGGLILQWGSTTAIVSGSSLSTAFPIVFPNTCFRVYTTVAASGIPITQAYSTAVESTVFSFTAYHYATAGGTASYNWFAIGR